MQAAFDPASDFDEWANLARQDPAAFERRRKELIEQSIAEAPDHLHERLRRLQWRVDVERSRYKHPLKSCTMIYGMMWDSVYGEHGLLAALRALREPLSQDTGKEAPSSAEVVSFARKKDPASR